MCHDRPTCFVCICCALWSPAQLWLEQWNYNLNCLLYICHEFTSKYSHTAWPLPPVKGIPTVPTNARTGSTNIADDSLGDSCIYVLIEPAADAVSTCVNVRCRLKFTVHELHLPISWNNRTINIGLFIFCKLQSTNERGHTYSLDTVCYGNMRLQLFADRSESLVSDIFHLGTQIIEKKSIGSDTFAFTDTLIYMKLLFRFSLHSTTCAHEL